MPSMRKEVRSLFCARPLILQRSCDGKPFFYDGCNLQSKGFVYRCKNCKLKLDHECTLMRLVIIEGQGVRIHPHHDHKFQLIENVLDKRYNCTVCLEYCSDHHHHSTYGCIPCDIFIHDESCFERKLPPKIQQFYGGGVVVERLFSITMGEIQIILG